MLCIWANVPFPVWKRTSFFHAYMTFPYIRLIDLPAVVRQSSSSLLSWQLSWPLHKKLRSTQRPFRHLKRASEHTSGLPAAVESEQRSSISSNRVSLKGLSLKLPEKQEDTWVTLPLRNKLQLTFWKKIKWIFSSGHLINLFEDDFVYLLIPS